jgi:hypothetical protein
MKLQKLNFRPKVLRKEDMIGLMGGYTYKYTSCNGTGGTSDCSDGSYDN